MNTEKKQAELVREISGVNPLKCMKCGKCSATCPAYNEMDIKCLYTLISRVVCEMRGLDADEAIKSFNNSIDDNVRNLLCKYNIELVV